MTDLEPIADAAKAWLCVGACALCWIVIASIWRVILGTMNTSKLPLALAAALGSLLIYIPDLVKLVPGLPPVVANALCAVILSVAYALVPKQAPPPAGKSGEAGYVRMALVQLLGLAALFALVACAALKSAEKDPLRVLEETKVVYDKAQADAVKGCATTRKLIAAGLVPKPEADAAEKFCHVVDETQRVRVEVGDAKAP